MPLAKAPPSPVNWAPLPSHQLRHCSTSSPILLIVPLYWIFPIRTQTCHHFYRYVFKGQAHPPHYRPISLIPIKAIFFNSYRTSPVPLLPLSLQPMPMKLPRQHFSETTHVSMTTTMTFLLLIDQWSILSPHLPWPRSTTWYPRSLPPPPTPSFPRVASTVPTPLPHCFYWGSLLPDLSLLKGPRVVLGLLHFSYSTSSLLVSFSLISLNTDVHCQL